MMRKLFPVLALAIALVFSARGADTEPLATHVISVEDHGKLELLIPTDWTLVRTNMQERGNPYSVELHSPSNTIALRLTIYWDGFGGKIGTFRDAQMDTIVSNVAVRQYVPISVEKTVALEKLRGPGVTGSFARFTDAGWTPVVKDEFKILTTGMFHCGNLWGNFDLLCNDKNGPSFNQGLQVMESLRRVP
jgi:hypothetical protein